MGRKKTASALVKKDYRHTGKAYEAICIQCGCTYYPMNKNSIYCSTQCNNDAASFKRKSQGINLSNGGVTGIANPVSFVKLVNPVKVSKALTTGSREVHNKPNFEKSESGITTAPVSPVSDDTGSVEVPEKVSYDALFDEHGRHTEAGKEFVADLHAARNRIMMNGMKANPALYEVPRNYLAAPASDPIIERSLRAKSTPMTKSIPMPKIATANPAPIPMGQGGITTKALTTGRVEVPKKASDDALFDEYGHHTEAGKEFVAYLHEARKRISGKG